MQHASTHYLKFSKNSAFDHQYFAEDSEFSSVGAFSLAECDDIHPVFSVFDFFCINDGRPALRGLPPQCLVARLLKAVA